MKPAPFDYQAPSTLREAIDLLASNPEAFVIAGGQSLMPVLAFRLATPSLLADLRRLPGLGNIVVGDDGSVRSRIQRTRALRRINTAALFTAVPKVRIRFPPAVSHVRTASGTAPVNSSFTKRCCTACDQPASLAARRT
jgi:hypothetical protein